ncbi:MAG: energy-coupling factor ABC transporter ATP-binding protein, partial [Dehalococcoidia bacterium]|nr:energy-coupling factor ABC transporter ATP-binding protein [Dehalococcoidia bacterium]
PDGARALHDVSLTIEQGERVAILGQNGSGKTTLARHLNGLLRPTRGRVRIFGQDIARAPVATLARSVGYLFQNPDDQLFAPTVWQEAAFGPRNLRYDATRVRRLVDDALDAVGLAPLADHNPRDLSYHERKLLALASVLAMATPIVVLDEPTTGQDLPTVARIGGIVQSLSAAGVTVIAVTHDLEFCADHFPRCVVMADGAILLDGPSEQVLCAVATLARTGVEPPQLTRLGLHLGVAGVLTEDDLLRAIATEPSDSI